MGVVGIGLAAVSLAARFLPLTNHVVMFAAVLCPYLGLAAALGTFVLLIGRLWALAIIAALVLAASISFQAPMYRGPDVPAGGTSIRVLTANLQLGQADPRALVSLAKAEADVVAVQELTPDAALNLSMAGMDATFPFRFLEAKDYASGVGLWSRYPIKLGTPITGYVMASVKARIQVPGVLADPTIIVVHMSGPWPQPMKDWLGDLDLLPRTMDEIAATAGGGADFVVGDFNSTMDMRPFRELLKNGYRDAAEQAGAGITPTYPGDMWIPPIIAIDHVITRNCNSTAVQTAELPGSDHRALVATVDIPK